MIRTTISIIRGSMAGSRGPLALRKIWRLRGGGRDRFDIGGYFFQVSPYDYDHVSDWQWDTDDLVSYPDPDHDGWYLVYHRVGDVRSRFVFGELVPET